MSTNDMIQALQKVRLRQMQEENAIKQADAALRQQQLGFSASPEVGREILKSNPSFMANIRLLSTDPNGYLAKLRNEPQSSSQLQPENLYPQQQQYSYPQRQLGIGNFSDLVVSGGGNPNPNPQPQPQPNPINWIG